MKLNTLISMESFSIFKLDLALSVDEWFNLIHTWNRLIGGNEDKFITFIFLIVLRANYARKKGRCWYIEKSMKCKTCNWKSKEEKFFFVSAWTNGHKIKSRIFSVVFLPLEHQHNFTVKRSKWTEQRKVLVLVHMKNRPSGITIPLK